MTVKSDLQKAVASAESAKGTYLVAAQSTEDATAKQKYEEMAMNIESHVTYLNSRIDYLNGSNIANSTLE
ncbi:MAG: rubrerythrin family protein [Firmicutes bacterium HGW-Firmicutes-15]|nr:MAG: rubrerythrin family protein [Firmicutes bacterium HGW-Firmicutes-15]